MSIYMFIIMFSVVCACSCGIEVRTCYFYFVIFYEPNISFVYALVCIPGYMRYVMYECFFLLVFYVFHVNSVGGVC